jgi:predicted transcriptional regulator
MQAISLRLEPAQYKRLRLLSFSKGKPMSILIRDALEEYLKENQQAKPGQEWFWSEAWQSAEREVEKELATGAFETFDNMDDFLKDLK